MADEGETRLLRALRRAVTVRPVEVQALLWSFAYFFLLLASYYVLRPLRDEMGIVVGVENLQWLFTATFFTMLGAVPLYGALVTRLPRRRFIPIVYHFFVVTIAIFWIMLTLGIESQIVARLFFVWITVFSVFVVSIFWSFMSDLFSSEQGKRLFGFIAAGGQLGALVGPSITVSLVGLLGPVNLLIIAALLLEGAVLCVHNLERHLPAREPAKTPSAQSNAKKKLGGGWLDGIALIARSPYLAGIALWVSLLSLAGTFLYFQQANIVAAASDDPIVRTRIFASVDLTAGLLALLVQLTATGRLISRFGVGPAAAFLPLVFMIGFAVMAASPIVALIIIFQAAQRVSNFAISNPAREILFTVVSREEKFKAKNIIDVVVFRGADAVSGWLFASLRGLGLELSAISLATIPVAGLWLILSLGLGRKQERLAHGSVSNRQIREAAGSEGGTSSRE